MKRFTIKETAPCVQVWTYEEKTKLATARKNLDNYILSMFSGESSADE